MKLDWTELQAIAREHAVDIALSWTRHALRNRLGSIRNANHYLRRRLGPANEGDAKIAQFFGIVDEESKAACALLDSFKTSAHEGARPSADAVEVATALLGMIPAPEAVQLLAPAGADRPRVGIHEPDLAVALLCLVENALDAVAGRGTVRVAVARADGMVAVSVHDDGPGFPSEPASLRSLEPFVSSRGRPGLGLATARRVLARWGGRLAIDDLAPGEGARVSLLVPPCAAPEVPS